MLLAVDTETTGLDIRHGCRPFAVSTCTSEGVTRLWQWPVDPYTREVHPDKKSIAEIRKYLTGHTLIFHNALFDLLALQSVGIGFLSREIDWEQPEVENHVEIEAIRDTAILSHLIDSRGVYTADGRSSHGLKELALCYLEFSDKDERDLRKATVRARNYGSKQGWKIGVDRHGASAVESDYWMVPLAEPQSDLLQVYAVNDAIRTMGLYLAGQNILRDDDRLELYKQESLFIPLLYMMEHCGIHVHAYRFRSEIRSLQKQMDRLCSRLIEIAGSTTFNPRSDHHIRSFLFRECKLHPEVVTKTGQASVKASVLSSLRSHLESSAAGGKALAFLQSLIGYIDQGKPVPGMRSYKKSLEYLASYDELLIQDRLHPNVNPVGTKTTRFSMRNPNGQNVSKKSIVDEEGNQITVPLRSVFSPPPGFIWASIDYSQLELRIFASLSAEQSLIEAFEWGHDFHSFVAERIFQKPAEKISSEERRIAKNTNFALIYGGGPGKVDATAGMPGAYDLFSKQFPNVKQFMRETIQYVRKHGHILTADGYPLRVPPKEPYKGVDYRIQGTAGRIIKLAMLWLCYGTPAGEQSIIDWQLVRMPLQVHDELLIEISTTLTNQEVVCKLRRICSIMEAAGESMGITTPVECRIHAWDWNKSVSLAEYANLPVDAITQKIPITKE